MKPHTLSVLVENRAGVLSRVAGLFSRRGFNIESLAVGTCEEPTMSRMTIVVIGDDAQIEQVMKQLNKLIDVIKVSDITENETVERELALIKVSAEPGTSRAEVMQIASIFRALIVDVGAKTVVLQVTGDTEKIDALESLLNQYGVKEMVRTGKIALLRGAKTVKGEIRIKE
jgi:acetolactate synthase-1/3 small subunit